MSYNIVFTHIICECFSNKKYLYVYANEKDTNTPKYWIVIRNWIVKDGYELSENNSISLTPEEFKELLPYMVQGKEHLIDGYSSNISLNLVGIPDFFAMQLTESRGFFGQSSITFLLDELETLELVKNKILNICNLN
jgi:hypothetical protein